MSAEILAQVRERMEKTFQSAQGDFKKIRTGRAQVDMLDGVRVNYYGQLLPLKQVASISTPDARTFVITPWDTSVIKEIEQAIVRSDLGLAPMSDGKVVRLKMPELSQERRQELVKQAKRLAEEKKVALRNIRREFNEQVKKMEKDKILSEDQARRLEEDIQKILDEYVKKMDQLLADKEKQILAV